MLRTLTVSSAVMLATVLGGPDVCAQQTPVNTQGALTLPDAIQIAQRNGARARAARYTVEAARATAHAFSARERPQVFLVGDVPSYNRSIIQVVQPDGSVQFRPQQQTNAAANLVMTQNVPWTGGSFSVISQLAQLKRTGAPETWSSTPFSVNLTQPILRSNALSWTRTEQALTVELAEYTFRESMEDVASATTAAFLGLYSANAALRNATENRERNGTLKDKVNIRVRLGTVSSVDVRQAELAHLRAQLAVSQATLARDEADAALRAMLGWPAGAELTIVSPGEPREISIDTGAAIVAALRFRSDVVQFELQDTRARRAVSEARWNNGVGATISASYGYNATASGVGDVYSDLQDRQAFRLNLTLPLMQWGASSADIEAARVGRAATTANAQESRDQIRRDVVSAVRRLTQAREGYAIAVQADTVADSRLREALLRYDFGSIPTIETLFLAQNDRDQAVQQLNASLTNFWTEYYRLRRVTMYDFETGRPIR